MWRRVRRRVPIPRMGIRCAGVAMRPVNWRRPPIFSREVWVQDSSPWEIASKMED